MSGEEAIRGMRERMPWGVAQKVLRRAGVHRGRGWDLTLQAVEDGDHDVASHEQALLDSLEEHLLCGEKLVQFYRLQPNEIRTLREIVADLEPEENQFSDVYPLLVDVSEARAGDHRLPILTAVVHYEHGSALVYASIRYLTSRETLGLDELPDEAAAALREFSEVIGIRRRKLEAIDVVWIPTDGEFIELRADFPWGMLQSVGETMLANLAAACAATVRRDYLTQPINLFPAIQSLYDTTGDGTMVELGFMVSGSAQKLEKSRRAGHCCRIEAYHVGGKSALSVPIQPYRTSVVWQDASADDDAKAEVSLSGTSLMTADPQAFLGTMTVRNCADMDEYDHVRDRILAHVDD